VPDHDGSEPFDGDLEQFIAASAVPRTGRAREPEGSSPSRLGSGPGLMLKSATAISASATPSPMLPRASYDPSTLKPRHEATRTRLAELGWSRADFEGKTVLDIGAGDGLLSLHAHDLGAGRISACDIDDATVRFFGEVVRNRKLPVAVARKSFKELSAPEDQADVVLFMDVLHLAVAQGMRIESVIERLARLTRGTLYMEFPWSPEEASGLTEADYSPDRVIDQLTRHFGDVRLVRFMGYPGFKSGVGRLLVRASGKRLESAALIAMPLARPLDVSLPQGRHANRVVQTPDGYLFLKMLAPESRLLRASPGVVTALFDELHRLEEPRLVLPRKLGRDYLVREPDGSAIMAFPLLGGLGRRPVVSRKLLTLEQLLDFLVALRGNFASVSDTTTAEFRDPKALDSLLSIVRDPDLWDLPVCRAGARREIETHLDSLERYGSDALDCIQHGDVQTGNLLNSPDGRLLLVDLDNLSVGTAYSDGFTALVWFGAESGAFAALAERCRQSGARAPTPVDVGFSALRGLHWLHAVTRGKLLAPESPTIARFLAGFSGLMSYSASAFRSA